MYQICSRTVMDTSDPDITFDSRGVSNWATSYDAYHKRTVDAATRGERKPELDALIKEIKEAGKGKPYDCVVGISGGVDSTFLILEARRLGLRPLAVHFDSGWNSEFAVANVKNIVSNLDLDFYAQVVNWHEMRDLQLAFLRASVANCDIPTDHAFPAVAFQQAAHYGIKYILSGSNTATESVLPKAWGYNAQDAKHVKAIHKRFGSVPLRSYPMLGTFRRHVWYPVVRGIKVVKPLNFMRYVKSEAKEDIQRELGWKDYGGKHYESVFTRYFQGYYLPEKFGFDKRRAHLSSLILAGQLTRDEALAELQISDYSEELRNRDHQFIAKKLGLTPTDLDSIVAAPAVDHLSYPNNKRLHENLIKFRALVSRK